MRYILSELEGVYGINAYGELLRSEQGNISLFQDMRVPFLIYEHNWLMKQRLEFMVKKQILKSNQLQTEIKKFDEILYLSEKLKKLWGKKLLKKGSRNGRKINRNTY